nr:hypothetical protein [Tanacetum cinerariifolium]
NSYVYDPNPNSFDYPPDSYHPPHPTYETYSYDSYGNDSQFGYDCQPQFPLHYESEPGYNENYNSYPYDSSSLPQQYLCCACCGGPHDTCQCDQLIFDDPYCKHCGGPHMNYQCQPMNQDSYNFNSLGFDQPQPPQSPVIHQPPHELSIPEMEDLKQQYLDELQRLNNLEYRDEIKIAELKKNFNGMSIEIRKKEKLLQEEQWAYLSTHPSKRLTSFCFDDDDDDEDYTFAITPDEPVISTEEPDNSLSMGDEHLDTISATESDEFIKSGVENLIPIPKFSSTDDDSFSFDKIDYVEASPPDSELVSPEVNVFLAVEDEFTSSQFPNSPSLPPLLSTLSWRRLTFDNSLPEFTTFSKVPFDAECESDSSDDQSCFDEEVLEKIVSKPLPEEEIIPMESLRTHDSSLLIWSKIDSLLDEFAGELTLLKSIPPGIDKADCDFEEDIRDILIPKDLPSNNSLSFAEKESFHFDIPPFSCPPAKPPDGDTGILNIKMMGDISDQKAFMHKLMITLASHQEKSPDLISHRCGNVKKFNTHQFVSANSDAKIKSFSPSPILVKDSDSLMDEIDLLCTPDYPTPSGIEDKDYDSERDILILKDLPSNNTLSFAEKESFHFDIPPFSRPPPKPPDGDT